MSNTQENYMNKANAAAIINKLETKLNNRYTKDEVDNLVASSSGGHTIENASGTALTQRDTLQFKGGLSVSDDSTNEVTVVTDTVPEIEWSVWNAMTPQEQEAIPNALILNAPDSGGGSGIEWITKEQWDTMTPEQQSTGTYGVRGLGSLGEVETASITNSGGSPLINFRKKDGIIFTEPVGTIVLPSGSYNPYVLVAEYDIPSGFGAGHDTIYAVMMTNHKNILTCGITNTKIVITSWTESVTLASEEWAFFPSVTYLAD